LYGKVSVRHGRTARWLNPTVLVADGEQDLAYPRHVIGNGSRKRDGHEFAIRWPDPGMLRLDSQARRRLVMVVAHKHGNLRACTVAGRVVGARHDMVRAVRHRGGVPFHCIWRPRPASQLYIAQQEDDLFDLDIIARSCNQSLPSAD